MSNIENNKNKIQLSSKKGPQEVVTQSLDPNSQQNAAQNPEINKRLRLFIVIISTIQAILLIFIGFTAFLVYLIYMLSLLPFLMRVLNTISLMTTLTIIGTVGLKREKFIICGSVLEMILAVIYFGVFLSLIILGITTFGAKETFELMNFMHWILLFLSISYIITSIGSYLVYLQVKRRNDWIRKNPTAYVIPDDFCN